MTRNNNCRWGLTGFELPNVRGKDALRPCLCSIILSCPVDISQFRSSRLGTSTLSSTYQKKRGWSLGGKPRGKYRSISLITTWYIYLVSIHVHVHVQCYCALAIISDMRGRYPRSQVGIAHTIRSRNGSDQAEGVPFDATTPRSVGCRYAIGGLPMHWDVSSLRFAWLCRLAELCNGNKQLQSPRYCSLGVAERPRTVSTSKTSRLWTEGNGSADSDWTVRRASAGSDSISRSSRVSAE